MNHFLIITFFILFSSCENLEFANEKEKINGLSFVAPSKQVGIEVFEPVKKIKANWVSLMPFAFVKKEEVKLTTNYGENQNFSWWGETPEGISKCTKMAHQNGQKVMIKPHLWVNRGEFVGDLTFKTNEDWLKFETQYQKYIIDFAKVADSTNAEMFCIGTELKLFVKERPAFWSNLIVEVKKVYKGKLTYAENWDAYDDVPFWNEVDYIGIDGYFPLTSEINPTVSQISTGWNKWKKEIRKLSIKNQKPVIFTEIGFQAIDKSLEKPWETIKGTENQDIQANAYLAMFDSFKDEKWFYGIFVWKWFPTLNRDQSNEFYSPQGRKAEQIIRTQYSK